MQNSSDRQREVIYNITYVHLAFCLCRGIACIYKNLAVACGRDCFPGVEEEKSSAIHRDIADFPNLTLLLCSVVLPLPLAMAC